MSAFADTLISIAFHGLAFAMVLYLISVGLSVTMGLMGFVNLAHGVFAMLGGYVLTRLMSRYGAPFLVALPAFLAASLVSWPASLASCLALVSLERSCDWAAAVNTPTEPKSKRVRDARVARVFMEPPLISEGRLAKRGAIADKLGAVFFGGRGRRGGRLTVDS